MKMQQVKENFFFCILLTAIAVGLVSAAVFFLNAYLPLTATIITITEKICGICLMLIVASWIGMYIQGRIQGRRKEKAKIKLFFRQ